MELSFWFEPRRILAGLAASLLASTAGAQDTTRAASPKWMVAYSMGVPGWRGEAIPELFTFGVHFTKLGMGTISPDFALTTAPMMVAMRLPVMLARGGAALPMAVTEEVVLAPSAGASILTLPITGGTGIGMNVGLALAHLRGARVGMTWHRFPRDENTYFLVEVGIVSHSHAPAARSASKLRFH